MTYKGTEGYYTYGYRKKYIVITDYNTSTGMYVAQVYLNEHYNNYSEFAVELYSSSDLYKNFEPVKVYDVWCTCGAIKTKQPGHSTWCDLSSMSMKSWYSGGF